LQVFYSLSDFNSQKGTVVTIGSFDGVHLGHQKIINQLVTVAKNEKLESVVLTFLQHPRNILQDKQNIFLLNSNQEKIFLLEKTGIDNLIILPFNMEFASLSGEDFVKKILVEKIHVKKIIIGYDHRFGKNRMSNIDDLIQFGEKYHFNVTQISAQEINEISISSTKIRNAISTGNIALANKYLGYTYNFTGKVVMGKQLGRTINFPTANIEMNNNLKLLPKNGVYIVRGFWDNKLHDGMMNIGNNPTVSNNHDSSSIEIHFFSLSEDLYSLDITVFCYQFIREEKKFDNLEDLKAQLFQDEAVCKAYFNTI
jgi:riboflavin kinase/FMN adenylyltransferase